MPAKHRLKAYIENGYYHLYNQGVNRQVIFTDQQDYQTFLSYLQDYLSPKDLTQLTQSTNKHQAVQLFRLNNFAGAVDLLAYCLMPNHFHLLVKQSTSRAIESFMRSLQTRYAHYFKHRHNFRTGTVFADTYKAVIIKTAEQLVHLTRFIHHNPAMVGIALVDTPQPSSLKHYLGLNNTPWVKPQSILACLPELGIDSYTNFVQSEIHSSVLEGLTID